MLKAAVWLADLTEVCGEHTADRFPGRPGGRIPFLIDWLTQPFDLDHGRVAVRLVVAPVGRGATIGWDEVNEHG